MNKCFFIGRTTKDIELKQTQTGKTYAKFGLAIDSGIGDNKKTFFLNMTVFGKSAEIMKKYVSKGIKIAVECEAQQSHYTDKNGNKVNAISFIVVSWEFAQGKNENQQNDNSTDKPDFEPANSFIDISDNIGDDDLPF